jgi:uncharacterized protein YjbI with pentapeptide repeats
VAREDHIDILNRGEGAWASWRQSYPDVRPDLSGAMLARRSFTRIDLSRTDLRGADLSDAWLRRCDLDYACLIEAKLTNARLHRCQLNLADLTRADLFGADLTGTDLTGAKLVHANLAGHDCARDEYADPAYFDEGQEQYTDGLHWAGAKLRLANLTGVDLRFAKLHRAIFDRTILFDVDFTSATGLNTCLHRSTSAIDQTTLRRNSKLPDEFLRGLGLMERDVEAYKAGYPDCLIVVEFSQRKWGDILPIELALRATLGNASVEKNPSAIRVLLSSAAEFQSALDAVIPVLVALNSVDRDSVRAVRVVDGSATELISDDQLVALLTVIQDALSRELPLPYALAVKTLESIPYVGPIIAEFVDRTLKSSNLIRRIDGPPLLQIYDRYRQHLASLKDLQKLSPGPDRSIGQSPRG